MSTHHIAMMQIGWTNRPREILMVNATTTVSDFLQSVCKMVNAPKDLICLHANHHDLTRCPEKSLDYYRLETDRLILVTPKRCHLHGPYGLELSGWMAACNDRIFIRLDPSRDYYQSILFDLDVRWNDRSSKDLRLFEVPDLVEWTAKLAPGRRALVAHIPWFQPDPRRIAIVPEGSVGRTVRCQLEHLFAMDLSEMTLTIGGRPLLDAEALPMDGTHDAFDVTVGSGLADRIALVLRTPSGRRIVLEASLNDTVAAVGRYRYPHYALVREKDRAVLNEGWTLIRCDLRDGDLLDLVPNSETRLQLFIKTLTGKTITIAARPTENWGTVKEEIQRREGIPSDQQRMVFAGREMEDDKTVGYYYLHSESTLHLVLRLRGGGMPTLSFVDVGQSEACEKCTWSRDAPAWRVARPGLSVEGRCKNATCLARDRMVICNLEMGGCDLVLDADRCKCPQCGEGVTPVTCAFSNCWWKSRGWGVGCWR